MDDFSPGLEALFEGVDMPFHPFMKQTDSPIFSSPASTTASSSGTPDTVAATPAASPLHKSTVDKWDAYHPTTRLYYSLFDANYQLCDMDVRTKIDKLTNITSDNYSGVDDAYILYRQNQFELEINIPSLTHHHQQLYIQSNGSFVPADNFYFHIYAVKQTRKDDTGIPIVDNEDVAELIQHLSAREKKEVQVPPPLPVANGQVVFSRLQFKSATLNNARTSLDQPHPNQQYFRLVLSLIVKKDDTFHFVLSRISPRLILRGRNPGNFQHSPSTEAPAAATSTVSPPESSSSSLRQKKLRAPQTSQSSPPNQPSQPPSAQPRLDLKSQPNPAQSRAQAQQTLQTSQTSQTSQAQQIQSSHNVHHQPQPYQQEQPLPLASSSHVQQSQLLQQQFAQQLLPHQFHTQHQLQLQLQDQLKQQEFLQQQELIQHELLKQQELLQQQELLKQQEFLKQQEQLKQQEMLKHQEFIKQQELLKQQEILKQQQLQQYLLQHQLESELATHGPASMVPLQSQLLAQQSYSQSTSVQIPQESHIPPYMPTTPTMIRPKQEYEHEQRHLLQQSQSQQFDSPPQPIPSQPQHRRRLSGQSQPHQRKTLKRTHPDTKTNRRHDKDKGKGKAKANDTSSSEDEEMEADTRNINNNNANNNLNIGSYSSSYSNSYGSHSTASGSSWGGGGAAATAAAAAGWKKDAKGNPYVLDGKVGINTLPTEEALTVHGNVLVTGNYLKPSDARVKTNITVKDGASQLENIEKLQLYEYDLKHEKGKDGAPVHETGVLAQELKKVLPSAVQLLQNVTLADGTVMPELLVVQDRALLYENIGATKELGTKVRKNEANLTILQKRTQELRAVTHRAFAALGRSLDYLLTETGDDNFEDISGKACYCTLFGLGPAWTMYFLGFILPPLWLFAVFYISSFQQVKKLAGVFSAITLCVYIAFMTVVFSSPVSPQTLIAAPLIVTGLGILLLMGPIAVWGQKRAKRKYTKFTKKQVHKASLRKELSAMGHALTDPTAAVVSQSPSLKMSHSSSPLMNSPSGMSRSTSGGMSRSPSTIMVMQMDNTQFV